MNHGSTAAHRRDRGRLLRAAHGTPGDARAPRRSWVVPTFAGAALLACQPNIIIVEPDDDRGDAGPGSSSSSSNGGGSSSSSGDGGNTSSSGGSGSGGSSNGSSGGSGPMVITNPGNVVSPGGGSVSCDDDPCDENATCENADVGVTCTCNDGYLGNGVTCESTDCETLTLDFGDIDCPNGANFGDTCEFSCNDGFEMSGSESRICTSDRTWTGDTATCTAVDPCVSGLNDCDENATCTTVGAGYTCECNDGFIGSGQTCETSDCSTLTLDNGTISCPNGAGFGDSCSFSCDDGYELSGSDSRICTSDGTWSGTAASCNQANACENGTANCDENATCEQSEGGYTCTCNQGYIGNGETCTTTECAPLGLTNGDIDCPEGADEGDTCYFTCHSGFQIAGSESRRCTSDSTWTGSNTSCTNIDECALDDDDCDENATCTDTPGFYECECDPGWTGDGTECTPEETPEEALVAYWKFNEGSGGTTADETGNGSTCSIQGATWVSNGVEGWALSFDGSNDYLDCGNRTVFSLGSALTYAAWVKFGTPALNWSYTVFGKGTSSQLRVGPVMSNTRALAFLANNTEIVGSSALIAADNWEHVAVTYDSTLPSNHLTFYVNGVAMGSRNVPDLIGTNSDAGIIGYGGPERWAKGLIDEVRIYHRALTADEMASEYSLVAAP